MCVWCVCVCVYDCVSERVEILNEGSVLTRTWHHG